MSRSLPIRETSSLLASMLLGVGTVVGQSTLPAAQPTASTPAASVTTSAPATGDTQTSSVEAGTPKPATHLDVAFVDGKLTVDAANTGLNQVLHEIAQKTGMKVSGGVTDEKVFGHYGPLPAADVLASLLDGTGSNMLLVDNKSGVSELILTPRRGGASPPNPNASVGQNDFREQEQNQYVPPVRPFQPPVATGRGPVGANPDGSPAFGAPSQNSDTLDGPGETPKTPQQIYEQLQSLGSQQQQTPPQD